MRKVEEYKWPMKVGLRVEPLRGIVVVHSDVEFSLRMSGPQIAIQVISPEDLANVRSGMLPGDVHLGTCTAFAHDLEALFDRYNIPRYWTEVLT